MTLDDLEAQIAALQSQLTKRDTEIAALRVEVAAIATAAEEPSPRRAPYRDPETVISYPVPVIALPNRQQAAELLTIVANRYPDLRLDPGDWRQVIHAVYALSRIGTQDQLNGKRYLSHWLDLAHNLLQQAGMGTNLGGNTFIAAAMVTGVRHNYPHQPGEVITLGLNDLSSKRIAPGEWADCLKTKQVSARMSLNHVSVSISHAERGPHIMSASGLNPAGIGRA
jgi:hypothetical protein